MDKAIKLFYQFTMDLISEAGKDTSPLTQGLDVYLPQLYKYSTTIMNTVMKPIALTILALFLLLEVKKIAEKQEQQGTNEMMIPTDVGKLAIKLALCLLAFANLSTILNAFVGISIEMVQKIQKVVTVEDVHTGNIHSFIEAVNKENWFTQFGVFTVLLLVCLMALISNLLVKAFIAVRFLELYLLMSVSPIPLSTLPNDEWSSIGKNFFKLFGAHAFQGVLLFLVLSFYPILIKGVAVTTNQDILGQVGNLFVYSIVLIMLVISTNRLSKSLTTAA